MRYLFTTLIVFLCTIGSAYTQSGAMQGYERQRAVMKERGPHTEIDVDAGLSFTPLDKGYTAVLGMDLVADKKHDRFHFKMGFRMGTDASTESPLKLAIVLGGQASLRLSAHTDFRFGLAAGPAADVLRLTPYLSAELYTGFLFAKRIGTGFKLLQSFLADDQLSSTGLMLALQVRMGRRD